MGRDLLPYCEPRAGRMVGGSEEGDGDGGCK